MRWQTRRPRMVAVASSVILVAALAVGSGLSDRLDNAGIAVPGSGSKRAADVEASKAGVGETLYAVVRAGGRSPAALRSDAGRLARVMRADSRVVEAGAPQLGRGGRTAIVELELGAGLGEAQKQLDDLTRRARSAEAGRVDLLGRAAVFDRGTEIAREDLGRSERLALPVTFGVLLVAFLSAVAAAVPVALALLGLAVTFALLALASLIVDMTVYVTNTALLMGLALSIDYSLFVVTRYREERRAGAGVDAALDRTLRTSGRAILLSGVVVAASVASLAAFGVPVFSSMAIGASIAACVAALGAVTVVPAVLKLLGDRIDRLTLRPAARAAERGRLWRSIARFVSRRRVPVLVASALALVALALPAAGLDLLFPSASTQLPPGDSLREATDRVAGDFGPGVLSPLVVVTRDDPAAVAAELRGQDGVAAVSAPERRAGGWHELTAVTRHEENTPAARAVVRDTRGAFEDRGLSETFVGGQTAEGMDLTDRIEARTPLVVAVAALIGSLLLLVSFRSVVVPLKAVLTTLLSVAAALGLTTLAFQGAGGSDGLAHFVPPLLFAIAFGLSMDYEVFLLSRIREAHRAGAPNDAAIERGLVRSGRPITLAALVMVVVFAAMATSRLEPFQQLGVGLAAAVLIDATIVRCALVPAAMAVMGRANWWMPALRRRAGTPRTATTTAR